jgi:galactonate dehydratase
LKFDPFGDNWRMLTRYEFDLSIDIIRAVRQAVGDAVDLLIEGHCRFNPATAIQLAEAMAPFRPAWFEEPVHHAHIPALIEVARRSPVPIATGENLSSKQQFSELLKHDVVNILQPEPLNLGGLFATRKIADLVDAHYGVVAPHSAQGPVCSAACVQLNASLPNFFIHEIFDEFNEPCRGYRWIYRHTGAPGSRHRSEPRRDSAPPVPAGKCFAPVQVRLGAARGNRLDR